MFIDVCHIEGFCTQSENSLSKNSCTELFITARQRSFRKIMFSDVSVHQSVSLFTGIPCNHYQWYIKSYCTGPSPTLFQSSDLIGQAPYPHGPSPLQTWNLTKQGASSPARDIWWSSLETCSNLFASGPSPGADICWLLNHVWSAQAGDTHPTGMLSC